MEKEANIFERGCLCQLSVSTYSPWKALPKESEWKKSRKKKLDETLFKEANGIRSKAVNYLNDVSLPFPIRGLVFVPKDLISIIDKDLTKFKDEFGSHVDEKIVPAMPQLKEDAREKLNREGLEYNELDYPVDIKSKFDFEWRFIVIDTPGKNASMLSPELYEREKEKFVNTMEQAQGMAKEALRLEFADMVDHLVEKLTDNSNGKTKRLHKTMIGNFQDFFQTFKARNIWGDDDLSELVTRAEKIVKGQDIEVIRENDGQKQYMKESFQEIQTVIDANIVDRPTRKIKL